MQPKTNLFKYMLLLSLVLFTTCASLAFPLQHAHAASYGYETAPQNIVGVTKPTITFYFDTTLTAIPVYTMYLNGEPVAASYDKAKGTFTFTPDYNLKRGTQKVRMSIAYTGFQPIDVSWTFTVAENAISDFTAADPEQLDGFAALNDYRVLYGLPTVKMNGRLNASATAHAKYLYDNKIQQSQDSMDSLHEENSSKKGFFGKTPLERGAYFGYTSAVGEDAAYYSGPISQVIDVLFDAPYHRNPFLNPYIKEVGVGKVGDYTIIEFSSESDTPDALVTSPAAGDRYVPTSFNGDEQPDPLRIHQSEVYPVGYPIMAQYYGSEVKKVKLLGAELVDSNKTPVALLMNTPDNDSDLSNGVMVLPRQPLQSDSTYHVKLNLEVTHRDGSTKTEVKEWDFTTEPAAQIGKKKLHQNAAEYKQAYLTLNPIAHTASFGLNASSYKVDGIDFPMNLSPVIVDGSSYLYIRDLAAALGANVEWNDQLRAAVYTKKGLKVTLYTTKNEYELNGATGQTDTPAKLIGESTMVPVRLLAEVLGAKVDYMEATRTVKITY
ncbi:Cysteine-rich secretory protein family protein [Paenibacillus sp. 1_12]|uniref:stalk domain-containing protein n=1 Tax=Paenibacillus sp. 1_12 TaxID=1566278 RepID=UPI0008E7E516|nr:stalk domain-containing protein [Paenibacillus sp. 1_12]SFL64456.1 Cysteine-rich secretory protein family protein [Paenibacillus sp. 1_12]